MTTTVKIDLFSPRWGHTDKYTIVLEESIMTITMSARKATCEWNPDEDPKWSKDLGSDALSKILNNDSIYPPEKFKNLLVRVWRSWVNNELNDEETQSEFTELEKWVNAITQATPQSEYWKINF